MAFHLLKEGGFQAYVTPNKIIGSEYASVLQRDFFFQNTMLEVHDFTQLNLFDGANVSVVVVVNQKTCSSDKHKVSFVQYSAVARISKRNRISVEELKRLPMGFISFPLTTPNPNILQWMNHPVRLADICEISDGMSTDQAYRIQPSVRSGSTEDWTDVQKIKLVNTGTIDPFKCKWGTREISFLGYKGLHPILDAQELSLKYPKRFQQAQKVTIAIAGLSNRIEAVVLPIGVMSGVATVLLQPKKGVCPYALTALLNTQSYSDLYKGLFGMSGMTADILNYSSKPIGHLPIPDSLLLYSAESRLSQLGVQLHTNHRLNIDVYDRLQEELEVLVQNMLG